MRERLRLVCVLAVLGTGLAEPSSGQAWSEYYHLSLDGRRAALLDAGRKDGVDPDRELIYRLDGRELRATRFAGGPAVWATPLDVPAQQVRAWYLHHPGVAAFLTYDLPELPALLVGIERDTGKLLYRTPLGGTIPAIEPEGPGRLLLITPQVVEAGGRVRSESRPAGWLDLATGARRPEEPATSAPSEKGPEGARPLDVAPGPAGRLYWTGEQVLVSRAGTLVRLPLSPKPRYPRWELADTGGRVLQAPGYLALVYRTDHPRFRQYADDVLTVFDLAGRIVWSRRAPSDAGGRSLLQCLQGDTVWCLDPLRDELGLADSRRLPAVVALALADGQERWRWAVPPPPRQWHAASVRVRPARTGLLVERHSLVWTK